MKVPASGLCSCAGLSENRDLSVAEYHIGITNGAYKPLTSRYTCPEGDLNPWNEMRSWLNPTALTCTDGQSVRPGAASR